jgi:hypothetical protein
MDSERQAFSQGSYRKSTQGAVKQKENLVISTPIIREHKRKMSYVKSKEGNLIFIP